MRPETERDVTRKRKSRGKGREVIVSPCADPARRLELEQDDEAWLRYYCDELFWYAFVDQQRQMIQAISRAIVEGGDQALAASRGEGKSKLAERLLLKHTLTGKLGFSILFAATGASAQDSLQSIMGEVEGNDRLHADYPEVCEPVRALNGTPNRAHYQTVTGHRHDNGEAYKRAAAKFRWCGQEVFFPLVPGSPSAGGIIATRGLESAVRGINKLDRRPDLAILDDPDTEESALSEDLAKKLEKRIDRGIAGLGGQKRTVARVMLTTLQNRNCVSFKFTCREQKPSWQGRRFRFLITPPTNPGLWSEYVGLRRQDWREDTNHAAKFYEQHRLEMDAGAEVANPNRFTPLQVSALQFYFDQIARTDAASVATEYDNDPPEEAGATETAITATAIQRQLSGLARGIIPQDCIALTHTVDVGKWKLHWVVRAWKSDGTGYVIDYGTQDVVGAKFKSDEGLDKAIRGALLRRMEEFGGAGYARADGTTIKDPLTLIDASYRTDAVYSACATAGLGVYPIMGFGKSSGCTQANFTPQQKQTADARPGDGWKMVRRGNIWLIEADADRWKAWEHDRWLTSPDHAGTMYLFGVPSADRTRMSDDERSHAQYAAHICSEVEVEEVYKGSLRRRWKPKSKENHWFDCSYYANVAANMRGIRLAGPITAKAPNSLPGHRTGGDKASKSLAEMAAEASGRPSLADWAKTSER